MGLDTSLHPVDIDLIRLRLVPYVLGERDIDDLLTRAARLQRSRARAKDWAIALQGLDPRPRGFDPSLHVWGRPYLVTCEDTADIAAAIDDYLAAYPVDVDAIARGMIDRLEPGLADRVASSVAADPAPTGAADAGAGVLLLREAYAKYSRGRSVVVDARDGRKRDVRDVLADAPYQVLRFAAIFRPGWMDRGVYPSQWAQTHALGWLDFFEAPFDLVGALARKCPDVRFACGHTIARNYSVGGYVPASKVGKLRERIAANADRIATDDETRTSVKKCLEALRDAELRELPFVEASEVYSAALGVLN